MVGGNPYFLPRLSRGRQVAWLAGEVLLAAGETHLAFVGGEVLAAFRHYDVTVAVVQEDRDQHCGPLKVIVLV